MAFWAGFYERLFNFREIRYFDIRARPAESLERDQLRRGALKV
jgi:4-hydroxyphenylpyruvate dioxygenase-like putative hemolysin